MCMICERINMIKADENPWFVKELETGYVVIGDKEVAVSDIYGEEYHGNIVIPSTIEGYPVTSIELDAFYNCTYITSVVVPDSVKHIGDMAFGECESLENITLGNGLTSIGIAAFSSCTSLRSITIPAKVTSIGYAAFYDCSNLTSITFAGTKAEWEAIEKSISWKRNVGNYILHCTDGDLSKSES